MAERQTKAIRIDVKSYKRLKSARRKQKIQELYADPRFPKKTVDFTHLASCLIAEGLERLGV